MPWAQSLLSCYLDPLGGLIVVSSIDFPVTLLPRGIWGTGAGEFLSPFSISYVLNELELIYASIWIR